MAEVVMIRALQDRADELPDFLDALEEWGVSDNVQLAREVLAFLASDQTLEIYREVGDHQPPGRA